MKFLFWILFTSLGINQFMNNIAFLFELFEHLCY